MQTAHRDHCLAGLRLCLDEEIGGRAADDHFDEFRRTCVADHLLTDQFAVTENRDAVCNAENLVQAMRDIDHADAAFLQRTDGGKEPLHFVGGKAGCRLIENQHVGLDGERPRNRHQRLFSAREARNAGRGIEIAADQLQCFRRPGLGRLPVDDAGGHGEALCETDILANRHPLNEAEILMDEGDRLALVRLRRAMRIGLAAKADFAAIRLVNAGERLDEGGFTRAVLAEKRQDFALLQVERHLGKGARAAEFLGDRSEFQKLIICHATLLPGSR